MAFGTTLLLLQLVTSPADERALRDAREAQQRFEATRRTHLPRVASRSANTCDAVVGRFCYWYDSTETPPPPEPARITAAREQLNAALEAAARVLPRDEWVAGQRVRYLLESGKLDDAARAARQCSATPWWCDALEGLALHTAEQYVASDSAFARALRGMPAEMSCEWTDLRGMTSGAIARELDRASCTERAELTRRLWQLSKPLWVIPGNDLATEHYSRQTMALILARAENAYGSSFGDDGRALLLRYGWMEWFSRGEPSLYQVSAMSITGHDREPRYHFYPRLTTLRSPTVDRNAWSLRDPAAPTRYSPRHLDFLGELRHQLARFPRGDSTLLVAAYALRDAQLLNDRENAALAILADEPRVIATATSSPYFVTVPRETMVVSLEVTGTRTKRAERARYSVAPLACGRWCLSDVLLFKVLGEADDLRLEDAAQSAIAETSVSPSAPLGVYWEAHVAPLTPLAVALTVEPVNVSAIRRVASRLRLASEPSTVRLRWTELADSTGAGHTQAVRLPASANGRLRLTLTVQPRGLPAQTAVREIDVAR